MITHTFDPVLRRLRKNARDFSAPLKQWYAYMLTQTAQTFRALGKKGAGAHRGVAWPWFAPIKIWGKEMPAEGHRVRHSFAVTRYVTKKGKKRQRPAKHYVQATSRLLQDTGLLRNAAMGKVSITPFQLIADTPVKYANWQQKRRPFVFITAPDADRLAQMINAHLLGIAKQ